MEGKLIKLEKSKYTLVYKEGNIAWENNPAFDGTLSLKNCEAIANGYDLVELFDEVDESIDYQEFDFSSFKLGFKNAIELLGDKKFSEEDVKKAIEFGMKSYHSRKIRNEDDFIQSLQQTEWDVEIEMWFHGTRHKKGEWIPKLDAEGCLILRRK